MLDGEPVMNSPEDAPHESFSTDGSGAENLILGAAAGYAWADVRPFVLSLRDAGYTGDLVLFRRRGEPLPRKATDAYRIQVEFFDKGYPYLSSFPDPGGLLPDRLPREPRIHDSRFMMYYLYLQEYGSSYSRVMLADVRDVYFQRDPFDFPWDCDLCCFLEDQNVTILESRYNRQWVKSAVGEQALQEIGHETVSCSGLTTGTVTGILRYLEQIVSLTIAVLLDETVPIHELFDQGLHNYLLYAGRLGSVRLLSNETGPVLTLGYTPRGSVKRNAHGQFLTDGGDVANVLHQYDRHSDILNIVLKRHYNIFYRLKRLVEAVCSYWRTPRKMIGAVGVFLRYNMPRLYAAIDRVRLVCHVKRSAE